jgi:restriction endonuclease S subunit
LDKSDWKVYKFDQIARSIGERVEPTKTALEIYVGLEHLDSDSIHIKRFGKREDVTGTKLRCYPGDVIFGRRRAYQRKAAIVEFDGFCSAHSLVLRANPDVIDPKLFPFFLHSDTFMHRAVDISVGSLSPTINWGTLKNEEFLIPPKDHQAPLAEILWGADAIIESERNTTNALIQLKHSLRKEIFLGGDKNDFVSENLNLKQGWVIKTIRDCCQIWNNYRKPISREEREKIKGEFPYYGPTGILDYISEYRIEGEFVLIGEDGDHFLKYADWSMSQLVEGKFNVNNHAHILSGTPICLTKWIFYSFQHRNIIPHITRQGASRYKLKKETLLNLSLLIPPVLQQ